MGTSDDDERGEPLGQSFSIDPTREISSVMDELEDLLKNGDVVSALSNKNINASLALTAIDGLRAYLEGRKEQAADDLGTVAEEIRARLDLARTGSKETN
ncbi:MAG: hypothetical protein IPM54_03835 [Polyangiaceae bacterium]|nr:hypothetical protein [Polyangiaceae bacterium]